MTQHTPSIDVFWPFRSTPNLSPWTTSWRAKRS